MKRLQKQSMSGRTVFLAILASLVLLGCNRNREPEGIANMDDFMAKKEAGLFGYGGFLFKYNPQDCQISVNVKRHQVRLQNDSQTNWLQVHLTKFPSSKGETIELELRYMSGGDEIVNRTAMETVKTAEGKFWLWDHQNNMGIILPQCW